MNHCLTEYQLSKIYELPIEVQKIKDRYPLAVYNAADAWKIPALPDSYHPKFINIYCGDNYRGPYLCLKDDVLIYSDLNILLNSAVFHIRIDFSWAYIQVEGKPILNRLGGVILPRILTSNECIMKTVLKGIEDV